MRQKFNISCPVLSYKVNENTIRIAAAYTLVFIALSIGFNNYFISGIMLIDFALRAFNYEKYSALKELSVRTGNAFQIKQKLTDAAPKKFAALLGFLFTFIIVAAQLLELKALTITMASALIFCALLESAFGICLGCYMYYFINIRSIKNN